MEPGEFAVRGGLIDIFPPGYTEPLRLDFFGDELDTIRRFDPLDQRTTGTAKQLHLKPASEFSLSPEGIQRFRRNYVNSSAPPKVMIFFMRPSAKAANTRGPSTGCLSSMKAWRHFRLSRQATFVAGPPGC